MVASEQADGGSLHPAKWLIIRPQQYSVFKWTFPSSVSSFGQPTVGRVYALLLVTRRARVDLKGQAFHANPSTVRPERTTKRRRCPSQPLTLTNYRVLSGVVVQILGEHMDAVHGEMVAFFKGCPSLLVIEPARRSSL